MPLRRLIVVSGVALLAAVAVSPEAALAAAKGTDRPLTGASTGSASVVITAAGSITGTASSTGNLSHLGTVTGSDVATFSLTGPATFSYTGTDTIVAANGDKLFSTVSGSGAFTSATTSESTQVDTITGGTGRFADASGTFTVTISSVIVSISATSETSDFTDTVKGQISY